MAKPFIVNAFTERECRVWCELDWAKGEDLHLEMLPPDLTLYCLEPKKPIKVDPLFDETGKKTNFTVAEHLFDRYPQGPEWFVYDILELGLEDLIQPGEYGDWTLDNWAQWALKEGIAPRQKFLLHIPRPHYHQDYYGEWDADYDWDVIHISPLGSKQIQQRWEAYLKFVDLEIPWVTRPPSSS